MFDAGYAEVSNLYVGGRVITRSTLLQFVTVLGLLVGNGCVYETFDREVVIRPAKKNFAYEILLRSHSEGRGNRHTPFDFTKSSWQTSYSICVNSLKGKIDATDLVFTQVTGCESNPSFWVDQKGYIEFRDGCLTIALEAAYTKESSHRPLAANGTYKIAQILDKPMEPSTPCER